VGRTCEGIEGDHEAIGLDLDGQEAAGEGVGVVAGVAQGGKDAYGGVGEGVILITEFIGEGSGEHGDGGKLLAEVVVEFHAEVEAFVFDEACDFSFEAAVGVHLGAEIDVGGGEFLGAGGDTIFEEGIGLTEGFLGAFAFDGIADGAGEEAVVGLAFDEVVLGAATDGLGAQRNVVGPGEDEDGELRSLGNQAADAIHALGVREEQVEKGDVKGMVREAGEGILETGGVNHFDGRLNGATEGFLEEADVAGVIFDEEDMEGRVIHGVMLAWEAWEGSTRIPRRP
jgi:hypothetical protein